MSSPNSPQLSPRKGKYLGCKVHMLDDTVHMIHVPQKCLGQVIFDEVIRKLNLLESDYFDLEFTDTHGIPCWLDHEKQILKQMSIHDLNFKFLVKFYTPDPGLLEEEYTRYLFALQVKRDLATGAMPCQEHTAVLLASYIVQAELGDFLEDEYTESSYLSSLKLLPGQTEEVEVKIMEHHREHVGQSPAEADFNLLDTARKVELYGIRMHPAKDHEGVELHLAVAHMGVLVFQNYTKINTFSWAKVRKLSFKRKKFLIKLHPEGYGYYKDTVEFYFESRNECKNFWKKCIEYHAFFRCHAVKRAPRNKTRVVSRGSSFRYSGRTQKQLVEYVRENYVKRPPFERGPSIGVATFNKKRDKVISTKVRQKSDKNGQNGQRNGQRNGRQKAPVSAAVQKTRLAEAYESPRSTSMRTVSTNRSAGATPNTGTLNSRDGHYAHNTSTSSGSHTLEVDRISRENVLHDHSTHVETAEVHDDSSYSGSRSLRDQERQAPQIANHTHRESDDHAEQDPAKVIQYGDRSPRAHRIDPAQFMLSHDNRKLSAPAFPISQQHPGPEDDLHLSRSPEVENIPQQVYENKEERYIRQSNLHRSQSETATPHAPQPMGAYAENGKGPGTPISEEESLPPPPPPIYEDAVRYDMARYDTPRSRARMQRQEAVTGVTSRSGTTSAASFTLTSSASITSSKTDDSEEEGRRKRYPADKAYYIAKELLMTERTYKKDLEVLTVWFRNAVSQQDDLIPEHLSELLFGALDPIYEFHCSFLKEVEQRIAMWEGKSNAHLNGEYKRIGDIMLNNMKVLQLYRNYIENHEEIITEIELAQRRNKAFEQVFRDFEAQKVCYLPLNTFLLKPAQRLLHYKLILERLLKHYNQDHPDFKDCKISLTKVLEVTFSFEDQMKHLENMQKLIELQRDLVSIDNLVQPNREFIREGCLQKLSRKGYQQRMFFLFSDMLVYTSRTATPSLQFKVHGQLPLRGMIVEETDPKMAVANSFTIYGGNRCLLVAAGSQEEKDKWVEDLQAAITIAKDRGDGDKIQYPSLKSNSSSEALEDSHEEPKSPPTPDRQVQHRANTTMHVCWHRNTSVSMKDHNIAVENQLSGYLLRKFKNSNGWQKLWVVFTNFCLFFYKTFQDDFPLASLPLLGYSVTTPSEADGIHKDYVFKLQFKNHVYFFRAESEYTFERWIEVISSATSSSNRVRMFSRTDSNARANSHQ